MPEPEMAMRAQAEPAKALRYAWVLSGRHDPGEAIQEPGPRTEFETFVTQYAAELSSLSSLDGRLPVISELLKRVGLPRWSLAYFVLSRTGKFDAVIASGEDIGVPMALLSLLRTTRVPIHMLFHGHHLNARKLRILAPLLRRLPHVHFHCLSETLRETTRRVLGIPAARCHATGHGVDTSYFTEVAADDAMMICSAGAANRDYRTFAAAVTDLPVSVKIAADSRWRPPAAAAAPQHWPANIELRSYGSYNKLRALYRQSRFVVVPLHPATHACGYAVMAEAMAMGRAVIATQTTAPPDYLRPGVTGLFVAAHDVEGLSLAISDLLGDPEKAARLGRQARELIVRCNSLETFCARLDGIIRSSVQESGRFSAEKLSKRLSFPGGR